MGGIEDREGFEKLILNFREVEREVGELGGVYRSEKFLIFEF